MENMFRKLTRGKVLLFIWILGIGGTFQTGFNNTEISSPAPFIRNFINSSWNHRYEEYPPSETVTLIWSLIIAAYAIGGLFGAASVKFVTGKFGRKKIVIGNGLFIVVGGVLMLTSKDSNSFEMIVVARFMIGFGAGLGGSVQMIYLAECSPKQLRGTLMLSNVFFLSLGKLSGQIFGLSELLGREHLWNILLFAPTCFVVAQLLTLPLFPEAPRYLLMDTGDISACRKALQILWGPGEYKVEIDEMLAERAASKGVQVKGLLEFLQDRSIKGSFIGPDIYLKQSATELLIQWKTKEYYIIKISIFSFDILNKAEVPVDQIRYITLGFGGSEVLATITATLIVERSGRKPLLLGGFSIMFTMLLLITIMLNLQNPYPWVAYCTAALFMIFIMCVSGGPSGVSMALINDSFEQSHHPAAMTLIGLQRWGQFAVLGFIFPFIIEGLGSYCFLLFACFCLLGALYSFFLVPETKGKSPKEISQQFNTLAVCGKFFGRNEFMETRL